MELEQRVKALEYEVKILKQDLQRVLLEIQEQVLIHYYPSLRADDTKPSDAIVQTVDNLRTKLAAAPPPAKPDGTKN